MIERAFYLLFFVVPLFFLPFTSELFEFNKMLLTYGITTVIVAAWAATSIAQRRLVFRRTVLDIPLLLFLLSQIISTITSIDQHTSVFSYYSRSHGGLLSTISYLLLYWAYVSNMDRRKTQQAIRYLLSSATVVAAWGILEHFGFSPSCLILRGELNASCWVQDVQERVFATLGQPNWMAAWLVALSPLAWLFAIRHSRLASFVLPALFFLALLYTKSRSGLLGFAAAYGVFWVFHLRGVSRYRKQLKNFLLFTFLFLMLALVAYQPLTINHQPLPTTTTLETDITPSSEIRRIVWKGAIDAWRAYPLFGSGVETFAYVYYQFRPVEHNLTSEWDFLYNKAHNEYLNFAATTGAFGLGAYLLLIGATIYLFLKLKIEKNNFELLTLNFALLAGYVSILVTNFFGFSVVPVATLFFLFPAMAFTLSHNPQPTTHQSPITNHQSLSTFAVLLIASYVLLRLGGLWLADVYYAQENAQKALTLRPGEPNYWDELAQGTALMAASLEAEELAKAADEASSKALEISPRNISFLKSRAVIMNQLAAVDEKYLYEGIATLEKAILLAPTEPKIHYNLGVLYSKTGQIEKAKELFEKALELKPDYEDAREGLEILE